MYTYALATIERTGDISGLSLATSRRPAIGDHAEGSTDVCPFRHICLPEDYSPSFTELWRELLIHFLYLGD